MTTTGLSGEETDHQLLERFDRHRDDQAVATDLVTRLRVLMLAALRRRWPWMASRWNDLEAGALMRLIEWRHVGRLKGWGESLTVLAEQLVAAEVEKEEVQRKQGARLREMTAADPSLGSALPVDSQRRAEARELLGKVLELIQRLPADQVATLHALIAEQSEDGPPMEEALGISKSVAKMRLKRARVALLQLAIDANLADDLAAFFESEA